MLFVTSTTQATRHGVYGIERNPPAVIQPAGASISAIVEQFPWGPEGLYAVEGVRDFIDKYAPGGFARTGAGYMAVIGKAWPILKVVRVLGSGAAVATKTLASSTPADIVRVDLKYKGAAGNSVSCIVTAASDGDANHFNLEVSISNDYGSTVDTFENLNYSGTGADSVPSFTNCYLTGSITKLASGRPANISTTFASGSDGSVTSASYVGTQGSANQGIALLESDKNIDFVFTGDPGNSLRAAVNLGLRNHADYTTDRIAFINYNSGATDSATVRTDVASYRSLRCCYQDVWAYQADDVDGTLRLVPPSPFAASCAANMSPSTSFSWKSSTCTKFLNSIVSLETPRGDGAYLNEKAGINTLQMEPDGGWSFECAVNTNAPITPAKKSYKRTRMAHYIAKSVVQSLREYVDSPNVEFNQQDEVNAVDDFLAELKRAVKTDPNNTPHIVDYNIPSIKDFNSQVSIDAGNFFIPANVKISSDQSKIFFSLQIGESVKIALDL